MGGDGTVSTVRTGSVRAPHNSSDSEREDQRKPHNWRVQSTSLIAHFCETFAIILFIVLVC